jgi:aminopeptidase N
MGDEPFRKAVTRLLEKHPYSTADARDFLAAIRETSGRSLEAFFDQWIDRVGHPVFEVYWECLESARTARLKVLQRQGPLFETPADVGIVSMGGKKIHRLRIAAKPRPCALSVGQATARKSPYSKRQPG